MEIQEYALGMAMDKKQGNQGHKASRSRKQTAKSIPVMEMTKDERAQMFADMAKWPRILKTLRAGKGDFFTTFTLVLLYLQRPGEPDAMLAYEPDYGDGVGVAMLRSYKHEIETYTKALLPGESLRLDLVTPGSLTECQPNARQAASLKCPSSELLKHV